jgi:hypothetical protein
MSAARVTGVVIVRSQSSGEGVVDPASGLLLEHVAGRVEIPVVAQEVGARGLRAAWRRRSGVAAAAVGGRVVDARACRDQVAHARLALDWQQSADVVDAQLLQGRVEIDAPLLHWLAEKHREQTLAGGTDLARAGDRTHASTISTE